MSPRTHGLASAGPLQFGFATFQNSCEQRENVLTVHLLTNGNMNLAYFDFKPVIR